jgi:Pentapeptide repeats (8 copies)
MISKIRGHRLLEYIYRINLLPVTGPAAVILLGLLAIAFLVFVIGIAPSLLYPPIGDRELSRLGVTGRDAFAVQNDRLMLQNAARTTLLQALAGLAVIAGLYFTWRQVKTSRDMHSTDRFIRAMDQLGRPDRTTEVALGGIYGLERVARDSSVDRRSIGEILTAYIRTRSGEFSDRRDEELPPLLQRAPDVQAAIAVLGRGKFSDVRLLVDRGIRVLDLSTADLRHADLTHLELQGAWMTSARLYRAVLLDADLSWVDLGDANMQHVIANGTRFANAWLHSADCKDGHFDHANFDGAILQGTDLQGAHLVGASFRDAFLPEANLSAANLKGAVFANTEADDVTVWPSGFDPSAFGIRIRNNERDAPSFLPPTRPRS